MGRKFDSGEATIMIVPAKLVKIEVDPRIRAVQFNNKLTPYLCCGDCKSLIQSVQTELATFRFRRSPKFESFCSGKQLPSIPTRKLVQIVYSIPASSVIIERLFSESGLLFSKKRRSMKRDKVTCTVYKYEPKLRKYLADALPDVVDIGSERDAIGNIARV